MKSIEYARTATYAEASLILLTHANARMVAWEHDQITKGYIVATETEEV